MAKFSGFKRANFAVILRLYLCANSHKKQEMIHFRKYRLAAGGNSGRNSAQYNTDAVLRVGLEGCCCNSNGHIWIFFTLDDIQAKL